MARTITKRCPARLTVPWHAEGMQEQSREQEPQHREHDAVPPELDPYFERFDDGRRARWRGGSGHLSSAERR